MKERQRWRAEEDALLSEYVKQYGPREWHLVSQRMNVALDRDAKSCLERWKNYLKPGIKKGSLTEDEQQLVIRLQAKHGNKWKKIAAEVPGRTAKRLGKWWEVFKEKQQRVELKENPNHHKSASEPVDDAKYNLILETFAEKLVKERSAPPSTYLMVTTPNSGFRPADPSPPPSTTLLPPWLSSQKSSVRPPSPSVTLTLSPSTTAATSATTNTIPWLQPERVPDNSNNGNVLGNLQSNGSIPVCGDNHLVSELVECCRELEEGHRALAAHKKESSWRLRRVELQLESEKACRKREKIESTEAKMMALREEQKAAMERIESEYREQLASLRREAEAKEQKLVEHWASKHLRVSKFLEQMGCRPPRLPDANGC